MSKKNRADGRMWVGDLVVIWIIIIMGWLCVYEVISGSAHVWWFPLFLKTDQSSLLSDLLCDPTRFLTCCVPTLVRKANDSEKAIRFDLRSIPSVAPPSQHFELDTAQSIPSLSFVFIILTAYLLAIFCFALL